MTRIAVCAIALPLIFSASAFGQFSNSASGRSSGGSAGGASSPFGSSGSNIGSNSGTAGGSRGGSSGTNVFSNAQGLGSNGQGFRGAGSGNLLQGMGMTQGGGLQNQMGANAGMNNLGLGIAGARNNRNQFGIFGNTNQNGMNGQTRTQMRIPVAIGFQPPRVTATARARGFEARLLNLPGLDSAKNITVTMEGRTAILTGVVESDHEKDLIGRLAKLEPGISDVQNDLEVSGTASVEASTADSP